MKKCDWCGKEYPDDATVCAIDQQPLLPAGYVDLPAARAREDRCKHLAARPKLVKIALSLLLLSSAADTLRMILGPAAHFSLFSEFYFSLTFATALQLWILYLVFRGKNWARWLVLCMLVLGIFYLIALSHRRLAWNFYLFTVVDSLAVALLFQRAPNEWFTRVKAEELAELRS